MDSNWFQKYNIVLYLGFLQELFSDQQDVYLLFTKLTNPSSERCMAYLNELLRESCLSSEIHKMELSVPYSFSS